MDLKSEISDLKFSFWVASSDFVLYIDPTAAQRRTAVSFPLVFEVWGVIGMKKWIGVVACFGLCAGVAPAAVVPVAVRSFEFSPAIVMINPGDSVRWEWEDGFHTTTSVRSSREAWNALVDPNNRVFERVFNTPGTFWYFCLPHGADLSINNPNADPPAVGMAARVVVVPAPGVGVVGAGVGLAFARRRRRASEVGR